MQTEHAKMITKMLAVPFSVIPPMPTVPLWPGWVLKRHVTLVVAPGGTGKGLLAIDMAARRTTGRPFPGEPEGTVHEPEAVVLIAPEDDANEAVAWRLKAAGADTSLVFNLTSMPDGTRFTLPWSVPALHQAIRQIEEQTERKVGLVIIDPLMACKGKGVSIVTNDGARMVIDSLEDLAHKDNLAVVLTHHTVKDGKTAGNKGLTDAARCVLRIVRPDKEEGSRARMLTVEKANVMAENGTIRYLISGEENDTCIVWPVEVENLAVTLRSRGYVIDPDMAAPAKYIEPVAEAEGKVELFQTDGGTNAVSLGKFTDPVQARHFAQQKCTLKLKWKDGPVAGSSGAASKTPEGKFTFFSVMPLEG